MRNGRFEACFNGTGQLRPICPRGITRYAGEQGWHLNVSILKDFQLPDAWKGDGIITSLNNSRALEDFICKTQVPVVDLSLWRMDLPLLGWLLTMRK